MIRPDLEAAGIPFMVEGPDGPLYADFHALRHSFIALLDRSGATLKEAMQLARHSDPRLTMAVYGRAQLHDLGQAVGRLPSLTDGPDAVQRQALAATGTDGPGMSGFVRSAGQEGDEADEEDGPGLRSACASGEAERGSLRLIDDSEGGEAQPQGNEQTLALQGFEGDCERLTLDEGSAPCRTRTYNPLIKSQPRRGSALVLKACSA